MNDPAAPLVPGPGPAFGRGEAARRLDEPPRCRSAASRPLEMLAASVGMPGAGRRQSAGPRSSAARLATACGFVRPVLCAPRSSWRPTWNVSIWQIFG